MCVIMEGTKRLWAHAVGRAPISAVGFRSVNSSGSVSICRTKLELDSAAMMANRLTLFLLLPPFNSSTVIPSGFCLVCCLSSGHDCSKSFSDGFNGSSWPTISTGFTQFLTIFRTMKSRGILGKFR